MITNVKTGEILEIRPHKEECDEKKKSTAENSLNNINNTQTFSNNLNNGGFPEMKKEDFALMSNENT